jgi:hypothetical protein
MTRFSEQMVHSDPLVFEVFTTVAMYVTVCVVTQRRTDCILEEEAGPSETTFITVEVATC